MKKALIIYGGWTGHDPEGVATIFNKTLVRLGFHVTMSETLDSLLDKKRLSELDLLVPIWTMGDITKEQVEAVTQAVEQGMGLAGCHGGLCDAFRNSVEWQFMTGGNWVAHPGNADVTYKVNLKNTSSPLVDGILDFEVTSEQYYLHVDPAVEVLATTRFPLADGPHCTNGQVDMPVVWTKRWGQGRVYYNALGHQSDIFNIPEALELMKRGFMWASDSKGGLC